MNNTRDLSKFGQLERVKAAQMLLAVGTAKDKTKFLSGENLAVEFNPNSGNVFLVDEDGNVAMLNGENLEDFLTCYNCGGEGYASEFKEDNTNECCQEVAVA